MKIGLKRRIKAAKASGSGRFPQRLKEDILQYAAQKRSEGVTDSQIAREMEIGNSTLSGWKQGNRKDKAKLQKVQLRQPAQERLAASNERAITIRFKNGVSVEGLSLSQTKELLEGLS